MKVTPHLLAFISLFLLTSHNALAGAWTQSKGSGQVILNTSFYSADRFYDTDGNKSSQPNFTKYELNPYIEYGLTDNITIGANLYIEHNQSDTANDSNSGIGDSEIFLRHKLWEGSGWVVSSESLVKLPSPSANGGQANIGTDNLDIASGFSIGYGMKRNGRNHYAGLDTSYRYRSGEQADQIRLAATLGIELSERFVLLPQAFATFRMRVVDDAVFTQSPEDDYNLVKAQLSGIYRLDNATSLQLGVFNDIHGANTGSGSGALISVWRDF